MVAKFLWPCYDTTGITTKAATTTTLFTKICSANRDLYFLTWALRLIGLVNLMLGHSHNSHHGVLTLMVFRTVACLVRVQDHSVHNKLKQMSTMSLLFNRHATLLKRLIPWPSLILFQAVGTWIRELLLT